MEAAAVAMQLGARSMWKRTLLEWSVRKREVQQVAATRPPPVRVVDLQRPPPPPEKEDPKADTMSRNSVMLKKYKFRAPQEKYAHHEFEWGKTLGLGTYSKVMEGTRKETGVLYALKIMHKLQICRDMKAKYVKLERMILDFLLHPGIVRLLFTFQDDESLYMAMECCQGGELRAQLTLKGRFTPYEARFYAAELVDVLEFIHGHGIVHRDLRLENILLTADGHVKLIDFGSARMLKPMPDGIIVQIEDAKAEGTLIGTAEYVSPEVFNRYTVTIGADLWALGCIIFEMLDGRKPFQAEDDDHLYQKVTSRQFKIPGHFDPNAKDLVDSLLDLVPERRPGGGPAGYAALKNHPYFAGVDWGKVREAKAPEIATSPVFRLDDTLDVHYPPFKARASIYSEKTDDGYIKEISLDP